MSFLRYAFGASYARFFRRLWEVGRREHRSARLLAMDFFVCFLRYGCGLSDYMNYRFWTRNPQERREYVTIKDADQFYEKVSPSRYKTTFSVKSNFMTAFRPYVGRTFLVPREDRPGELEAFLQGREAVMVKPLSGLGGRDVRRQDLAAISDLAAFHRELLDNDLFVEEVICQHPAVSELCPTSVNTIRVMTVNAGGEAALLYACLRVGAGGDVDNFHAGGMAVQVDLETGTLIGPAVNKICEEFPCHPVTGVRFDGRQLPMWDEVRRICLEASFIQPNIHVVGWDVAITPEGPVFVEGNRRPGFDLPQMTSGRGRKDIVRQVERRLRAAVSA